MEQISRRSIIESIQSIFSKRKIYHKLNKEATSDFCPDYIEQSHKICNVYTSDEYAICIYDELIGSTLVYNVAITASYDVQELYLEVDFEKQAEFNNFLKSINVNV